MPKLRVIIKPPPEPQGEPEQQVEALRDYLLQMSEELAYVLTHLEADNINDSTFERIQGMIPRPYTGLPVMDGDASAGQSEQWARGDHRHGHDSTKADVTALEETAGDLADHVADIGNPHEVTAAQVGLGNVENVRQYSASNPPPIPTPGEVGAIPTTEKGSVGGVAELDSNGMVPSAQLPSYVDDVLEYASLSAFPVTGESGKIYVALDTGRTYRWSGSAYVEISESLALGETSSTAYRGDRGKTAYDHSQVTSGNPHNVTAAEAGARPDTWTPSAADVGAQPSITANGILKGDGLGGVSAASAGTDYQAPLTAGTDYQTPLVAGTDYATPGMIPSVPDPSDAAPQDLGTADAGSSGDYSRADHVHNLPDADDIPYDNTGSGLSATDVQAAIDKAVEYATLEFGNIEGVIPSEASASNQLADKAFVTDSITQGTAIFRGSFASKAALLAVAWQTTDPNAPYYVSNNDYAVVLDDETQNDECWRYIYVTGTGWTPQYRINESPLTQAQLDALNSGATAAIINSVADKLDKTGDGKDVTATFTAASTRVNISTGEKLSVLFGKIAKWFSDLGTAAFRAATGSITSGSTDLVESGSVYTALADKQNKITASGILKGDGAGGVSAATAGTDYATPAQLAYVETGTTASRTYRTGEYFCMGGQTCRTKTNISSGASFTLGTNYEVVPGGGLNGLATFVGGIAANSSITLNVPYYAAGFVATARSTTGHRSLAFVTAADVNVLVASASISYSLSSNTLTISNGTGNAVTLYIYNFNPTIPITVN